MSAEKTKVEKWELSDSEGEESDFLLSDLKTDEETRSRIFEKEKREFFKLRQKKN